MTAPQPLTKFQFAVMDQISHCEMNQNNGATPTCAGDVNTYLWADLRAEAIGITVYAFGGVVSSLQNAGLIGVAGPSRSDPDGGIWFTDEGYVAWELHRDLEATRLSDLHDVVIAAAVRTLKSSEGDMVEDQLVAWRAVEEMIMRTAASQTQVLA